MARRVDEWVARTAKSASGSVAVQDGDRLVTYSEIERAAEQVRGLIAADGAKAGELIGIRMRRGWKLHAAMLGIWKHQCGYVPIDPVYPRARQDYMIADAGIRFVVEDAENGDGCVVHRVPTAEGRRGSPDTAYVIYTSGSTGKPKGVLVGHADLVSFLEGFVRRFSFGPDEVWVQFASVCFDASVAEIWSSLVTGARLLVVDDDARVDLKELARLLADRGATVLSQVPTVFRYLLKAVEASGTTFPELRHVLLGGEPIEPWVVARWLELDIAPKAELSNLYGPTECIVYTTAQRLTPASLAQSGARGTLIGTAMPHVRVELRRNGKPVPTGQDGEIHVNGALAGGYLGDPGKTAARFVRGDDGEIWYRTGDLATQDDEGRIRFLGRADGQIKLRGMRVELGEIEAHLNACDGVGEAAAVKVPSRHGDPIIVACYVPRGEPAADLARRIRGSLSSFLPAHMVPASFVEVPRLPLTLSGKLDRERLAVMVADHRG